MDVLLSCTLNLPLSILFPLIFQLPSSILHPHVFHSHLIFLRHSSLSPLALLLCVGLACPRAALLHGGGGEVQGLPPRAGDDGQRGEAVPLLRGHRDQAHPRPGQRPGRAQPGPPAEVILTTEDALPQHLHQHRVRESEQRIKGRGYCLLLWSLYGLTGLCPEPSEKFNVRAVRCIIHVQVIFITLLNIIHLNCILGGQGEIIFFSFSSRSQIMKLTTWEYMWLSTWWHRHLK